MTSRVALHLAVDSVVFPHPWDEQGLMQRLDQHQRMFSSDVCSGLAGCRSGGWHFLIEEVLNRLRKRDEPPRDGGAGGGGVVA